MARRTFKKRASIYIGLVLRKVHVIKEPFHTKDVLLGDAFDIGDYTYGRPTVFAFGSGQRLKIGKFCAIADGVEIFLSGNHRSDWVSTYPFMMFPRDWPEAAGVQGHPASKGDVIIGNDVWIGMKATILSGVTLGDGAVIGARAVVTTDVEPYTIVAGNPAHPVRKRFDDATIHGLLELRWWDWPIERIRDNLTSILMAPDDPLNQLISRVEGHR